jgi:hypothetical protein
MSIATRHDRKTRRTFSGQSDADFVVGFLNSTSPKSQARLAKKAKTRVLEVIEAISRLLREMKETPDQESGAFHPLNLMLSKYTSCPIFFPDAKVKRKWRTAPALMSKHSPEESQAVHSAVRLADRGLLDRIQLCPCGGWYFRRFSHQRFCSETCRVEFWENSEERKQQKRERARDNYIHHKIHGRR